MRSGVFSSAPLLPPTVIFHLSARYNADTDPKRVNLGVGAYRDALLKPVVFGAIRKAEEAVVSAGANKEYLPIAGLAEFRREASKLLFGGGCKAVVEGRVATVQTLSGTGSLTVAAHLLRRLLPSSRIFCSNPTWENHGKVVSDAGAGGSVGLEYYRYYDPKTCALDEEGFMADLACLPEGSVVLLHACAHNPTGVDPSREQWRRVADLMKRRKLLPWFDIAYQGFASGDLDEDAWAVRHFVEAGFEMLVSQSFAKNMGLYSERVGALHVVSSDAASAAAVLSNIEAIVRPMYSNPPAHGARVVAHVLSNSELRKVSRKHTGGEGRGARAFLSMTLSKTRTQRTNPPPPPPIPLHLTFTQEWRLELENAMKRVASMRVALKAGLVAKNTPGSWEHITSQIGMFCYTGLTQQQSKRMTDEFHVYMLESGRINVYVLPSCPSFLPQHTHTHTSLGSSLTLLPTPHYTHLLSQTVLASVTRLFPMWWTVFMLV